MKDRKGGKWMHYRIDDSDLFKRFLILSLLERISQEEMGIDRARLGAFLAIRMPCCGKERVQP